MKVLSGLLLLPLGLLAVEHASAAEARVVMDKVSACTLTAIQLSAVMQPGALAKTRPDTPDPCPTCLGGTARIATHDWLKRNRDQVTLSSEAEFSDGVEVALVMLQSERSRDVMLAGLKQVETTESDPQRRAAATNRLLTESCKVFAARTDLQGTRAEICTVSAALTLATQADWLPYTDDGEKQAAARWLVGNAPEMQGVLRDIDRQGYDLAFSHLPVATGVGIGIRSQKEDPATSELRGRCAAALAAR